MNNEESISEQIAEVEATIIDENKLKLIIKNIIELEKENVKTKEYNDDAMKKKIEKIIEEEVKCC